MGTEYRPDKNFSVAMDTGYRSDRKFWVTTGTGYRPNHDVQPTTVAQKLTMSENAGPVPTLVNNRF